ncbi:MAG: glycosyltransferase family 2 protein [Bacteroidales bacterium]|nr:glycosyltransferase family 2 protein [Bacteroidales bacterium]
MNFVDFVFFFYVFAGLYMLSLMILICFRNRKKMFNHPKGKPEPVSIILPCYNEGKTIGKAIESLLSLDYPKNMLEIIIVDDKSTDNSVEIIRSYLKKNKNIKLIINKRNSGKAAEPTNIGIRAAKYDLVALSDSDSFPEKDALSKMVGFLQDDKKVAGVTCAVLVKKPKKFIEQLQALEYIVITFTRKLLDFIDSIYCAPGPFALYRKKILFEVGLFDTKNN